MQRRHPCPRGNSSLLTSLWLVGWAAITGLLLLAAPAAAQFCYEDADCDDPYPVCVDNECVQCGVDAHCPDLLPVCDVEGNFCSGCFSNDDCRPSLPVCVEVDTIEGIPGYCQECGVDTDCDDGNNCTDDKCDIDEGPPGCEVACRTYSCSYPPLADGSECADDLFCNGADTCYDGSCDIHAGDPCPGADGDGNCSESCDEEADNCGGADPNGSDCTDGLCCNGADTCSGGQCIVHAGDPCPGPDGDGDCSESCNGATCNCTAADPNGSSCTDGLFCTGADTCSGGQCSVHAGDPCPGADGDGDCSETCDEVANGCTGPDLEGSDCTDGLFCTGLDTCEDGACSSHAGDPCIGPDGDGNCSESCDEQANNCGGADPNDSSCTDGVSCTAPDACSGGLCVGAAQDATCQDDLFCNGEEFCDTVLDCQPGSPPEIDDGLACTVDSCDEASDVVVNLPDDSVCDDGLYCTGEETCDEEEGCLDGPDPVQPDKVCREDPVVLDPSDLPGWPEGMEVLGALPNRLAYLAVAHEGLRIYDASNSDEKGSYLPERGVCPGDNFYFDGVAVKGNTAYVAAGLCGLLILNVSDPETPSFIARLETPGWAKDIKVHTTAGGETIGYLADYGGGLRVIQLTDPMAPEELGSIASVDKSADDIAEEDQPWVVAGPALSLLHVEETGGSILLYLTTIEGFYEIDASLAALPRVLGFLDTNPGKPGLNHDPTVLPQDALVMGNRAYVPLWQGGLRVLDLGDPNLRMLQELETHQAFFKVAAGGANLYVTEGQCGLRVFGTTAEGLLEEAFFENLENPIQLADGVQACTESGNPEFDETDPWAWDLVEIGGLVYVTNGVLGPSRKEDTGSFQTVDFRQPVSLKSELLGNGPGAQSEITVKIQLKFNKPSKDKIQVKVKDLALPAGGVPTDVTVNVGGAEFTGRLDSKGKFRSPDGRDSILMKQNKKTQLWKLSVKRKLNDFAADLADEGLANADNPKPGLPVTVPLTIEAGGASFSGNVNLVYKSELGEKGTAK